MDESDCVTEKVSGTTHIAYENFIRHVIQITFFRESYLILHNGSSVFHANCDVFPALNKPVTMADNSSLLISFVIPPYEFCRYLQKLFHAGRKAKSALFQRTHLMLLLFLWKNINCGRVKRDPSETIEAAINE